MKVELKPCPLCGEEAKIEQHFAAPFFNIECTCGLAMTGVLTGDQAEPPVYWVSDDKEEDVHSTKSGTVVAIFSHYENMPENYRQAFDSLVKKWNQRWFS